ncbi:MAG: glycosyltransferase family 39 protein, partial [Candidatus Hydrogenedentes bacterium]|nr:glycosyltransferase family 39 protein [Candidatus Hydrogenedentota bacterium]
VALFGTSEFALRLPSLVAGLAALPLFWLAARRWLDRTALPVALGLFAVAGPLIRYASELKQYSWDVAVALALLLAASYAERARRRTVALALWAVAGAAAVWCSHAAVFVLAGAGTVLAASHVRQRDWRRAAEVAAVAAVWVASFAPCYLLSLRTLSGDAVVKSWWSAAYMPLPPTSPSDVKWFLETFVALFTHPLGLTLAGLGAVAFLAGLPGAFRRAPVTACMLLAPVAVALLASGLRLYPFTGRFLLFTAPLLLPFTAVGVDGLRALGGRAGLRALVIIALLLQPALEALDDLVLPDTPEGVRPAVDYLAQHRQPRDAVYVYSWAGPAFRYYARRADAGLDDAVIGLSSRNDWAFYIEEIDALRDSGRVWFVFVPVAPELGGGEDKFFRTYLNEHATPVDELQTKGSSLFLYEFGPSSRR